jgi:hypothetical protein
VNDSLELDPLRHYCEFPDDFTDADIAAALGEPASVPVCVVDFGLSP